MSDLRLIAIPRHWWRGDPAQVLPFREFGRNHWPSSRDGLVVEDLDLVLRAFGGLVDDIGVFAYVECKYRVDLSKPADVPFAQRITFGLADRALREQEPSRYIGFWVVTYTDQSWVVDDPTPVLVQAWSTNRRGGIVLEPFDAAVTVDPRRIPEHVIGDWTGGVWDWDEGRRR